LSAQKCYDPILIRYSSTAAPKPYKDHKVSFQHLSLLAQQSGKENNDHFKLDIDQATAFPAQQSKAPPTFNLSPNTAEPQNSSFMMNLFADVSNPKAPVSDMDWAQVLRKSAICNTLPRRTPQRKVNRAAVDMFKLMENTDDNAVQMKRDNNAVQKKRNSVQNREFYDRGVNTQQNADVKPVIVKKKAKPQGPKKVVIPGRRIHISALSKIMGVKISELDAKITELTDEKAGTMVNSDVVEVLCGEYGYVAVVKDSLAEMQQTKMKDVKSSSQQRQPIICVMGHVDHGKTTLLDNLRNASVAAKEAGGITQAVGAFRVDLNGIPATFMDTPGHALFRGMRERGVACTDIVVLVVSAVDGVKPQTREAIRLAQEADAAIVVAINKCDIPGAQPDNIRVELSQYGVQTEEMGGSILSVDISAKEGDGIDALKEAISLQAEISDIKSRTTGPAEAFVLESHLNNQGVVLNALVTEGTLKVGDHIVCGTQHGKVRAMTNDVGKRVKTAAPSIAVSITGLKTLEGISSEITVVKNESSAKALVASRVHDLEEESAIKREAVPEKLAENKEEGEEEELTLDLFVKSDVNGSLEALTQYIELLPKDMVEVRVIRSALGPITEADIEYAKSFGASIVAFNVKAKNSKVEELARVKDVHISHKPVIYHLMDNIKELMSSRMPAELVDVTTGKAVFKEKFEFSGKKRSVVAGCVCSSGELVSSHSYKIIRDGEEIHSGSLTSLRHFQKEVKSVKKGSECGIVLDGFTDFVEGDVIECFVEENVRREIDDSIARILGSEDSFMEGDIYVDGNSYPSDNNNTGRRRMSQ